MPYFRASDGVELAYHVSGHNQGTPLVLLHGFPLQSGVWSRMLNALIPHGMVVLPDLRGFGLSPVPAGPYTMERFGDDIHELLQHLGIPRADIIGHSMGGYAALALAERHPESVLGLGLVHSHPYADDDAAKRKRYEVSETVGENRPAFNEGMVAKLLANPQKKTPFYEEARLLVEAAYSRSIATASIGMGLRPDRSGVWRKFSGATLLVAGIHDRVLPLELARRTHAERPAERPNDTYVELDCGHLSMIEEPAGLLTALLPWWGRQSRPGKVFQTISHPGPDPGDEVGDEIDSLAVGEAEPPREP
jgi:3-oxoadipate enol-lactonase